MFKKSVAVLFAMVLVQAAGAHQHDKGGAMPKDFDTLKQLIGSWEGTSKMEGKDMTVTTTFRSTAGDSVIEEKMAAGTPHEMINMYHKDGSSLAMTHYCAGGTQPYMTLKHGDDKSLAFEISGTRGISSPKEMHMHAVTLTMVDKDTLKEEWTNYTDGKKSETAVFNFKRKK